MTWYKCKNGHLMELGKKNNYQYDGLTITLTVNTPSGIEQATTRPLCIQCLSSFLNENFGMDWVDDA